MHRNIQLAEKKDILFWFTDLDGSFGVDGVIPKENALIMANFLDSSPNRKAAIGSGRAKNSSYQVLKQAGLEKYVHNNKLSISAYNGGLTYLNNELIHNQPFSTKISEELQIISYNEKIIATFFGKDVIFQGRHNEQTEWYTNFLKMPLKHGAIDLEEDMYMAEFVKPDYLSLEELRKIVISPENKSLINAYSFVAPFEDVNQDLVFFQANPIGVDKGLAVRMYIDALNLKPENVLVTGDAPNDISALNVEGITAVVFESKYNKEILPQINNPETFLVGKPDNGAWKEISDKIITY